MTAVTLMPGPGEPAEPPASVGGERPFRAVFAAWIHDGTDQWWRVALYNVPAFGPRRESVYAAVHAAWTREMERWREAGHPELTTGRDGRFTARLVRDEDGRDWWMWGATPAVADDEASDLPFVEDGGELPDYWREDHEAAEAEIAAGLGTFFEDDDAFDRALDEAAARPGAS